MTAAQASLMLVTANIGRGVGTFEATANIERVIKGFRRRPWRRHPVLIGWQEIDEADQPDEHGILHRELQRWYPDAATAGFETAVPVVIPPGWRKVAGGVTETCPGRAKVTPRRVAVQSLLEHEKTGIRVVHVNGHYPHNAPDLWAQCEDTWELVVEHWLRKGFTVITTRDRNHGGVPPVLSPFEKSLLDPKLIDKITVVQGIGDRAVRVVHGKPRRVNLDIDGHDAHGVPLTFVSAP